MPINLCCDVCQAFIKRVDADLANRMMRNKEPIICIHCEKTRDAFRKQCEKVLIQLQKESEQVRAGMESKFLEVMKDAIKESIKQNERIDDTESSEESSEAQLQ